MVIVHEADMYKYIDKHQMYDKYLVGSKKYQKGTVKGSALYLPRRQYYDGSNIFGDIVKFVSENKDTIKNIAGVTGYVVNTLGKVAGTTIDTIKQIKELKALKKVPISESAVDKVINASGFHYITA